MKKILFLNPLRRERSDGGAGRHSQAKPLRECVKFVLYSYEHKHIVHPSAIVGGTGN